MGAVLILLLLANRLQGERLSRRALAIGAAVTALALSVNLILLRDGRDSLMIQSVYTQSDLAGIEIAKRTVAPDFWLDAVVAGTPTLVNVQADKYLAAVDEDGSAAYTPDELAAAPDYGRKQADIVLSQALPLATLTRLGAFEPGGGGENCVALPAGGETAQGELRPRPRRQFDPGQPRRDAHPRTLRRATGGEGDAVLSPAARLEGAEPGQGRQRQRLREDENEDQPDQQRPPPCRVDRARESALAEADEAGGGNRDRVEHEAGRGHHISQREVRFRLGSPTEVPESEEGDRDEHDIGADKTLAAALLEDIDRGRGGERDRDTGEAEGEQQEGTGGDIAAAVAAFERQQHRKPEQDRAGEADLKRPEQDLPGGAEEEQQQRREEGKPIAHPASHVDEEPVSYTH